jgi:dTDP-4-amino-4,6-dideoxygalactose transaminase
MTIPFNKPFISGNELRYIEEAVHSGKISGDGFFTMKCSNFFRDKFNFKFNFLTTSCTDAIELASLLMEFEPGDEIIMPSFTFVSCANPFMLRNIKIIFADSYPNHPNIDHTLIESLITKKTKAILIVHYGGVACNINYIKELCDKYNLLLIEDCAHSIDSYYNKIPLGSFGDFSVFSFHETKNINSGEGGLLVVNSEDLSSKAEIAREKGTNRSAFFRGEINKYEWVDLGSSYLPSDIIAAFLFAQLENLDLIQKRRIEIYFRYLENLQLKLTNLGIKFIEIPEFASINGHVFYLICHNKKQADNLIQFLKNNSILAMFHYIPLHSSKFFKPYHDGRILKNCDNLSDCIVRLPLFFDLKNHEIDYISEKVLDFFESS